MEGQKQQDIPEQAVSPRVRLWDCRLWWWRRRGRRQSLGHLTVNTCPTLVALAGELVPHVQDVVVVQVAADMEAGAPGCGVAVNVEEAWVEVQVSTRVQALADTPTIFLTKCFAAQLSC